MRPGASKCPSFYLPLYVPVIIELDADKTASLGAQAKPDPPTIAGLVMRGLRAQLASECFVTGVLHVLANPVGSAVCAGHDRRHRLR